MFRQCDAWYSITAPGLLLERCPNPVDHTLIIRVCDEIYVVHRCRFCRCELVATADSEGIEILDELLYSALNEPVNTKH